MGTLLLLSNLRRKDLTQDKKAMTKKPLVILKYP